MTRADQRRWRSATAFDLGELTALWLEGEISEHPGYGDPGTGTGPDPETEPLVPVLAELNRAGFLTIGSQPGLKETGDDGTACEQRAAVEVLVDREHLDTIAVELATDRLCGTLGVTDRTKLIGTTHESAAWRCRGCSPGVEVTRYDGEPFTWFGGHLPRVERRLMFRGCRRAWPRIRRLYQVTLVDPVWGRNDVLWPWLLDLTTEAQGDASMSGAVRLAVFEAREESS